MATGQEFNQSKLSSSLYQMTGKKKFTDVVLICAEGEELAAHRAVLSAKSSYFEKMFLSNFKESVTKQVDYSQIDKNIMQLILNFIYLHSLENVSELSYSDLLLLYQTSHMFELKELSDYTWDLVVKITTIDNWLDAWNAVVLRGEESDICKVLRFIMKNLHKIKEREDFLGLSMPQMTNFLEKINEFKFATDDNFLDGIITWSEKNEDRKKEIQELLQYINFDFISKEFFSEFLECNEDLFNEEYFKQFLKKQILPRLKSKTEIKTVVKYYDPVLNVNSTVSSKIFLFGCDKEKINGSFIYENVVLRIFDFCTKNLKCIDNLPFHLGDGIAPVQHGSNIYIVGGFLKNSSITSSSSNLTQSIFLYDWKTNSVTKSLPPIPVGVTRDCHVCAAKDGIFILQNDCYAKNVFLYFSISKQEWFAIKFTLSLNVIASVFINNVLYVVFKDLAQNTYSVYTVIKFVCTFCCNIPIKFNENGSPEFSRKSVTVYKGKLYILTYQCYMYQGYPYCNRYWYIFSPKTKSWNINHVVFSNESYSYLNCFGVKDRDLMVYNENNKSLYRYNEENMELEEVMTITQYPPGDHLKYSILKKYEKMFIFTA